jgi:hypothetical protein
MLICSLNKQNRNNRENSYIASLIEKIANVENITNLHVPSQNHRFYDQSYHLLRGPRFCENASQFTNCSCVFTYYWPKLCLELKLLVAHFFENFENNIYKFQKNLNIHKDVFYSRVKFQC